MSARSTNNFSLEPLGANRIYIGKYDSVLPYACAVLTVNADSDCELTVYSSVDKIRTTTQAFQTFSGVPYVKIIQLSAPYVYFTLRNTTGTAQTYLNFDVIYREVNVSIASETAASVNIFDSDGASILSNGSNALQTYITNPSLPITFTPSGTQDVNVIGNDVGLALDSSVQAIQTTLQYKNSASLWGGVPVLAGGVSSYVSSPVYATRILSVFGSTSAQTTITLQMSSDGITFYDTQYTYDANGEFGYVLPIAFSYLRFKSSAPATITLKVSYC